MKIFLFLLMLISLPTVSFAEVYDPLTNFEDRQNFIGNVLVGVSLSIGLVLIVLAGEILLKFVRRGAGTDSRVYGVDSEGRRTMSATDEELRINQDDVKAHAAYDREYNRTHSSDEIADREFMKRYEHDEYNGKL